MADDIEIDDADLLPVADEPAAEEPKSSSLDDAINAALDSTDSEDAPTDGRARDASGRFAAKTESEADAAPDGTSDVAPVVSTEPVQNAQPDPVSEGHFRGWSPEQRQKFQSLPPEAQTLALDVVKGRDSYYSERLTEYDQAVKAISPLVNAVQPHIDRIRTITDDPSEYVRAVLDVDHRLQFAPYAEKVQLFAQLAKNIGLPFTSPQADPFADPMQPGGEGYPVVHDLRTQLQQVQHQLAQYRSQNESAQQHQTSQHIQAFASEKAPDGQPKYPHFERVRVHMGQMIDRGEATNLQDAYARAVQPINDAVSAEIAARQKAANDAQKAAVEKAKKARSVRSTGMSPGGTTRSAGIDAVLNSAMDRAGL